MRVKTLSKDRGLAVLVGVGCCHEVGSYASGGESSLRIARRRNVSPNSVPSTSTLRLTDEMRCSGGKGVPSSCDDLETGFARNKKNETGGFLLGTSFPKPAVA